MRERLMSRDVPGMIVVLVVMTANLGFLRNYHISSTNVLRLHCSSAAMKNDGDHGR